MEPETYFPYLAVGDGIKIFGLKKRTDLNDRLGVVRDNTLRNGRLTIELTSDDDATPTSVFVLPENLLPYNPIKVRASLSCCKQTLNRLFR